MSIRHVREPLQNVYLNLLDLRYLDGCYGLLSLTVRDRIRRALGIRSEE